MQTINLTIEDLDTIEAFAATQAMPSRVRLKCAPGGGISAALSRSDDFKAAPVFVISRVTNGHVVGAMWQAVPEWEFAEPFLTLRGALEAIQTIGFGVACLVAGVDDPERPTGPLH